MEATLDALLSRAQTYSAFADYQRHLNTSADLDAVVSAAQRAMAAGAIATVFNNATGERTELEPQATAEAVRSRLDPLYDQQRRLGPGRPRLGVVSREVSLLPRHWEWLAAQSGGASAALRRLVDQARKQGRAQDAARLARDATAKALTTLAGDQPGFEETLRALYRAEFPRAVECTSAWPADLRAHAAQLVDTAAALHTLALHEIATGASAPAATPDETGASGG